MIVYAARNFMTGKVYIGSTIQPFQTRLGDRKIPVKRGPWKAITEKNKTSIVALRKEGKSFTQIGKIFGANQSTIFYAIKRWTT